ncbi:MAG TPA: hypothetical protein VHF89_06045 [Solirubrobacteraceae bacterium]|nr:hypothetical protein [Solirubrobacteraceae bacterium]
MSAEQLVVLALLVAAFVAGWVARGTREEEEGTDEDEAAAARSGAAAAAATAAAPAVRSGAAPAVRSGAAAAAAAPRPDPAADAARAVGLASSAYEAAVERWLDERDEITPAGRAAVGELERALQRLDVAAARLDEVDETLGDAAYDALEALRAAARHLEAFRAGRPLDAATSRELERLEDAVAHARAALEAARP